MGNKISSYIIDNTDLMVDWDWKENKNHHNNPNTITVGSRVRVYWKCHICGGKWNTQMKERNGCPYCSGFKALPGFNDLLTTNPEIAKEWDYDNNKLIPSEVTKGSQKKVFWKCVNGHSYDAAIISRVRGQGCPFCSNKRVLTGYNDLETLNPKLLKEWDYDKNYPLTPKEVVAGSKKKVWWICEKGHSWQCQIIHRNKGSGCPVCANRIIVKDYNDLASKHPELASEWDYKKNKRLPSDYACYSREKVWWICKKGHSWKATIGDRSRGAGCPKCSEEKRVSFPEKAILYYVSKIFKNVIGNYRDEWLKSFELDMFLPDYNIGLEYDGEYGHSTKSGVERDIRKNTICSNHGVKLIRIRENACPSTNSTSVDYILKSGNKIEEAISAALRIIGELTDKTNITKNINIDLNRDSGDIYSLIDYSEKDNSLLVKNPKVALMWHPTKNGKLSPEHVSVFSSKKVWWKGTCNHEWKSTVAYEASSGLCPYCSGKRILIGFNDLSTINPSLSDEWDYHKNGNLKPSNFTSGSGKKVWWKCNKGHSWSASIVSRNRGNGCPICANRLVLKGYNDVGSFPNLVIDWDFNKNKVSPEESCVGSEKKVWWLCNKCGNSWKASINKRYNGSACPECAKVVRLRTVAKSYVARSGSLSKNRPDLVDEWDWGKNTTINPNNVTCGSTKKVWWICSNCKHSWQASICSRSKGRNCPKCADKERARKRQIKILSKKPSIVISHPWLAKECIKEKNTNINIEEITAGSNRKLWWKCSICGKEWKAPVCERTRGRYKCPNCNKKK